MVEKVSHTSLTTHSTPFSLAGGVYNSNLSGAVVHGADAIELQQLVNGSFIGLPTPVKFLATNVGGSIATGTLPAGTYRWKVPGNGSSVNTNIIGS
jgi:hypothetical protein